VPLSADATTPRGVPVGFGGMPESAWARSCGSQIKDFRPTCPRRVGRDRRYACYRWLRDRIREHAAAGGTTVGSSTCPALGKRSSPAQHLSKTKERPVLSRERLIDHLDRLSRGGDEPHVTIRSVRTCGRFLTRRRDCVKLDAEACAVRPFGRGSRPTQEVPPMKAATYETPGSGPRSLDDHRSSDPRGRCWRVRVKVDLVAVNPSMSNRGRLFVRRPCRFRGSFRIVMEPA